MSKKVKRILIAAVISVVFSVGAILVLVQTMYKAQYNSNGVSHMLVVTIDTAQEKEYIGDLEGHSLYIEKLNKEETVFRSKDAENVSIKRALNEKLVSIEDWKKYAFRVVEKDGYEILKYDNYEIAIYSNEIIIRPLSK